MGKRGLDMHYASRPQWLMKDTKLGLYSKDKHPHAVAVGYNKEKGYLARSNKNFWVNSIHPVEEWYPY